MFARLASLALKPVEASLDAVANVLGIDIDPANRPSPPPHPCTPPTQDVPALLTPSPSFNFSPSSTTTSLASPLTPRRHAPPARPHPQHLVDSLLASPTRVISTPGWNDPDAKTEIKAFPRKSSWLTGEEGKGQARFGMGGLPGGFDAGGIKGEFTFRASINTNGTTTVSPTGLSSPSTAKKSKNKKKKRSSASSGSTGATPSDAIVFQTRFPPVPFHPLTPEPEFQLETREIVKRKELVRLGRELDGLRGLMGRVGRVERACRWGIGELRGLGVSGVGRGHGGLLER